MTCEQRPGLVDEEALLLANAQAGPQLNVLTLRSPTIATALLPGQFVHVKIPGMEAHILRRPFSVYDTDSAEGTMDILYQVVGQGTAHLATLAPGATLDLIGPIGRSWDDPAGCTRLLAVAGGAGAPALFMQVKAARAAGVTVDVVLGAQTEKALVTRRRYADLLDAEPVCATDDGSFGYAGFATVPAAALLAQNRYDRVIACGPEPLMRAVAQMAAAAQVPCQVSLERRMACGVGACLSCVVDTVDGKQRACVDGPVFDAEKVVW